MSAAPPVRAFLIGDGFTIAGYGDSVCTTKWFAEPKMSTFGELLGRVASMFEDEGVLLLTGPLLARLGWPNSANVPGWERGEIGAFTTYWCHAHPTVHVADLDRIHDEDKDELGPWFEDTVSQYARWHQLTGASYHHTPGVAALAILRTLPYRHVPTWKVDKWPAGTAGCELPMHTWTSPGQPLSNDRVHFDGVRAGLAAITSAEVSAYAPKFSERARFDRNRAGYWLCDLAPWQHPDIPSPVGVTHGRQLMRAWLTTPTVRQLAVLAELGEYGGFEIRGSHTGPATRLFRPWGERIRDAYDQAETLAADKDSDWCVDGEHLAAALKRGYRQAHGLMNKPGGSVYRSDWYDTLTATQRVNTWRRAWALYLASGKSIAPLLVRGDEYIYALEHRERARAYFPTPGEHEVAKLGQYHETVSISVPFERGVPVQVADGNR